MGNREPSEMQDPQVSRVPEDERETKQPKLVYAVFDTDRALPLAGEEGRPRQVTILHTSYGRGLVEPAEDRSCPT